MKRFALILASLGALLFFVAPAAYAFDAVDCDGLTTAQCDLLSQDKLNPAKKNNYIWDIVRFIFILLGAVAVIMIIVGGFQYATSQGDSNATAKAKNTILYAVIGLAVALFATAIVTFIINQLT